MRIEPGPVPEPVVDFDIRKGRAKAKAPVFETRGLSMIGHGGVNLKDETIDINEYKTAEDRVERLVREGQRRGRAERLRLHPQAAKQAAGA